MLEFHHILPLSDGGKSEPDNAQLLCRECHLLEHYILFKKAKKKGDKKQMNANAYAIRKMKQRIKERGLYQYEKEPS